MRLIPYLIFPLALLLVTAVVWFSLVAERPMAKYAEQTRKEVYDTSRQFEQGVNRDVARYCETMRSTKEQGSKQAIAALIRSEVSTYDGQLSPDNGDCVAEAKAL
jgi:hypothetical protein